MTANPHLLAKADQMISATSEGIDNAIAMARRRLAAGEDRTMVIGRLMYAVERIDERRPDEVHRGLAVAIMRLAESEVRS